ncbi:MAG: tripartite tricarboxylate transporter substrate-binding protein [Burkholderiales bacterium]
MWKQWSSLRGCERDGSKPDAPTLAEAAGLPGHDAAAWIGYAAPAGTPREILALVSSAIQKALASFMRREQERYGVIIREAKIKIEN